MNAVLTAGLREIAQKRYAFRNIWLYTFFVDFFVILYKNRPDNPVAFLGKYLLDNDPGPIGQGGGGATKKKGGMKKA